VTAPPRPDIPWHALSAEAATAQLQTSPAGLSVAEAARRLAEHGPNRLPATAPRSALRRFLGQFTNLLIHVMLASAVIVALLGHFTDAAVILGVVLANAVVGFVQEGRAEQALNAIQDILTPHASALRDGARRMVDAADLVPGDIVLLEAGDRVPADLRLIRARGLRIDEAALTGESVPVDKHPSRRWRRRRRSATALRWPSPARWSRPGRRRAGGGDRRRRPNSGRISGMIGGVETLATPLLRQMDQFARQITVVILASPPCCLPTPVFVHTAMRWAMPSSPWSASPSRRFRKACRR
jgi:hypothetical protein